MEIQGFPGYLIYDDGRVWSSRKGKGRFLKYAKNQSGYHQVCLCRDGEQKTNRIARLVALHYIPNPENKPDVDHIDRDKDNNHVSNLRWATRKENCDNKGNYRNNTSGHKYISYHKVVKKWIFTYRKRGHKIHKSFETFDEAIAFKDDFLSG
jgi:hypothetical protein